MKRTTAVLSITLAAFIGGVSGYWYRGQVELANQAAYHAFVSAPARAFPDLPPGPPAPLISGGVPHAAPTR